ncbi:MAG: hypothetical protein WBW51_00960, partial [Methyloceanibacter sp.]
MDEHPVEFFRSSAHKRNDGVPDKYEWRHAFGLALFAVKASPIIHTASFVTPTGYAFRRETQQSTWFEAPRKKPRYGGFGASPVPVSPANRLWAMGIAQR